MSRFQKSILLLLFSLSAGLNIYNYYQKSKLETQARQGALQEGQRVEPLRVLSDTGGEALETFQADRRQILFVFSSDCQYSEDALLYWKPLAPILREKGFRLLALATKSDTANQRFQRTLDVPMETISPTEEAQLNKYFRRTPQTVVLNRNGTVLRAWSGLPQTSKLKRSIALYLELE